MNSLSRSIDEALEHNDPPTVIANLDAYNIIIIFEFFWERTGTTS